MKYIFYLLFGSFLLSAAIVSFALNRQYSVTSIPAALAGPVTSVQAEQKTTLADVPAATSTPTPTATPIPESFSLTVPFTSQAPLANWDNLHENSCEETSLIMVQHFLNGTSFGSAQDTDTEITNLVNWETTNGYGPSITLEQLNKIAGDYSGQKNGHVVSITNVDAIKAEIAAGHPVILGMAGKLLANPHFKDGGPNYHMLVVTGYDSTGFITNDPGTKSGEGYHYDYQTFYNAIHNWNADNIVNGTKEYLVFR